MAIFLFGVTGLIFLLLTQEALSLTPLYAYAIGFVFAIVGTFFEFADEKTNK
jgi:hypothetical protein